jgi:hypothetical protein
MIVGGVYLVAEMADDLRCVKGDFIKMDMGGYEPEMEGPRVFKRALQDLEWKHI